MSNLSPDGRALVTRARGALRASEEDRVRVSASLRAKLGAAALPVALAPQTAAALPLSTKPAWLALASKVLLGAGIVAGVAYVATFEPKQDEPPRRMPPAPLVMPVAPATPPPAPIATAPAASGAQSPAAPPRTPPAAARPPDRLAQEVAILSRATRELRSGRAQAALKSIEEHQRRFPAGLLSEERRAAKAQALCALGRIAEAKAELSRLANPQSPNAARARQMCDARSQPSR
jgi:hypothetical protein